jgi:hypothetical protein
MAARGQSSLSFAFSWGESPECVRMNAKSKSSSSDVRPELRKVALMLILLQSGMRGTLLLPLVRPA